MPLFSPPTRCSSVHSVGSSGLLLRHPDCPVRSESLQQELDWAPTPRGGLRHRWGAGQQGQHNSLECDKRLQPQPCPWQEQIYLCASVQRSGYVNLPLWPFGRRASSLSAVNCSCSRLNVHLCSVGQEDTSTIREFWLWLTEINKKYAWFLETDLKMSRLDVTRLILFSSLIGVKIPADATDKCI